MTARPSGDRRTLLIATDRAWTLRALCARDTRFADGPFGNQADPTILARQLAHRCRAHCPAVRDCAAEVIAHARVRRHRQAVRAGLYFPDSGPPKLLPDTGCGLHCAGLPAVHRAVAHA